jgi:hypothetical protein
MVPQKCCYGSVVTGLSILGEEAAGYLAVLPVVGHALAAQPLARAGGISAGAVLQIICFITIHWHFPEDL